MRDDAPRTQKEIHIDDLANPMNADMALAAMREGENRFINLSVDFVVSTAVALTGLDDLGPPDFTSRLSLVLAEVDRHQTNTAWAG